MPSVFHYTDSAGLIDILTSKSLFATDYRYLNDVTEGSMIRQLILPIFEAEIAQLTPKLLAQGFLKKRLYEDYGAEIQTGLIRRLLRLCRHGPAWALSSIRRCAKRPRA
jgi:hypothetical protein